MYIQPTNVKSYPTIEACRINFGGTVSPSTVAEQAQRALRDLYRDAVDDGIAKKKLIVSRIEVAKDALSFIFKQTEHKEAATLGGHIILTLVQFYNKAFRNGINRIEIGGWANATMARRQIADFLESDGFKYTAKELRKTVADDLDGDY